MNHHEYLTSVFKVRHWSPRFLLHAPVRAVTAPIDAGYDEYERNSPLPQIEERVEISQPSETLSSLPLTPGSQTVASAKALPEPVVEEDTPAAGQVPVYGEPVAFNLAIMIAGDHVLIDGVDGRIDPVVRELKRKLANNIIKMFRSDTQHFYELSWPLFDHPDAPKDAPTAREYVQSKLKTFVEHDNATLIVCGKVAEQYCIGNNHKPGDRVNSSMGRCLITVSLSQLLSSPKMKREFYEYLMPLLKDED